MSHPSPLKQVEKRALDVGRAWRKFWENTSEKRKIIRLLHFSADFSFMI